LRFFAPQGQHVAPMGVKFGTEKGTKGRLLRAKLRPYRCNGKGIGPPKLKFLLSLTKIGNIKRPARGASLARVSRNLQNLYLVSRCVSCWNFVGFAQGVTELRGF